MTDEWSVAMNNNGKENIKVLIIMKLFLLCNMGTPITLLESISESKSILCLYEVFLTINQFFRSIV